MKRQAVLVTGGAGYLGSVLSRRLAAAGHPVVVVDSHLTSTPRASTTDVRHIEGDVRSVADWGAALRGVDAVVHLAAIVGDPACDLDHDLTWETNYLATVHLVEACRAAGVRRFVLASTCSNYGLSPDDRARIHSPMQPRSLYAQTKIFAEHHVLSARCPAFSTSILRFATLYGISPRMRFDLAVNTMTAMAVQQHKVVVHGGSQWRPLLHVEDAAQALLLAVGAPAAGGTGDTYNGIYNCGSDGENYQLRQVGQIIVDAVPSARLVVEHTSLDPRDYQVDFTSARLGLGLRPRRTVHDGVGELAVAVANGRFGLATDPRYSNVETVAAAVRDRPLAAVSA
ncbi:NAD-dependent epimerase/dehydratase family protein [Amycolatopsis sp. lyj-346]|uniref:NAD-dependent epimerase/dehydratase family protein n=1 Tax=Amycolatopsis sp. lyj-346 TaxID=2789289 RepID=UPI00397CC8D4